MQLKRIEEVQWLDLPKVESPHLAGAWVESHALLDDSVLWELEGLDDVIWDELAPCRHVWDSAARLQLLERVERAEVVLVHGFETDPVSPALVRGSNDQRDNWNVDSSLSLEAQYNLRRLLAYAYQTRTVLEPIPGPAPARQPAPTTQQPEELTVTNPRWEHVDQQRSEASPDNAIAGDRILLKVDVSGAVEGSRVTFKVYNTASEPAARVAAVTGNVEAGIGSAEWTVKVKRRKVKLEFEGAVRRTTSERAEIPLLVEFAFSV